MADEGEATSQTAADDTATVPARLRGLYRVSLPVFEGPLDLLLHLIKKSEVEIVDIPIATITEQYLAYLEVMRGLSLDVAGEFLVMAATLTLIKSRMLLPPSEEEEEEEEADPRADLVRQLLEYQRYREAALALSERPLLQRDVFAREPVMDAQETGEPGELPLLKVTVWELLDAFRSVLKRLRPEAVHEIVTERISLRDRVRTMLQALSVARSLDFDSLFDEDASRFDVIITFLALLELMKMGAARATQEERYGRIVIELAVTDVAAVSLESVDEYDRSAVAEGGEDGRNRSE
ncbi:MAG TPA: segregation/condensation protein A [Candidatus Binatia bacterium]